MDKTILRNFAVYSRNKLIQDIKNKGKLIGITEKGIENPISESSDMLTFDIKSIAPYKIHGKEVKQYRKLIEEIKGRETNSDYETAYNTLVEEVAYTWFNRLIAIRFMEINNYLPDKMRVLSSGRDGVDEPEFLTHYEETSLEFTKEELDQILDWKLDGSAGAMEKIFHLLFIKQCNALNKNLPELFEEIDDYAELLLNISYIDEEGVLYKLVHDIPESYFDIETEDGNGQVEIIGWMYQYYNTEPKAIVDENVKKGKKVSKEQLPAKTQLFTPDWIVRYMVENSLGRLWIEKLIFSGDTRNEKEIAKDFSWKYYIPEANQNEEVQDQLIEIRKLRKELQLEDIKFIDPAMGSFHIGVYAFEVFMQLYESQGYTAREASRLIIENNLYGIDIDKRAYQLSYFACMMKGRQYNRGILNGEIKFNLYAISESNNVNRNHLDYFGSNINDKKVWEEYKEHILEILDTFVNALELGSMIKIEKEYNYNKLIEFVKDFDFGGQLTIGMEHIEETQDNIIRILKLSNILSKKYDIVISNPPYLGRRHIGVNLVNYLDENYNNTARDLFAAFMEKCNELLTMNGYYAMINQHSWMFLSSYESFRKELLKTNSIVNMLHLGAGVFEGNEVGTLVQSTAFIISKINVKYYNSVFLRLINKTNKKDNALQIINEGIDNDLFYETNLENFGLIPGSPVAYWASNKIIDNYRRYPLMDEICKPRQGMATCDNQRFLRLWHEVSNERIEFGCDDIKTCIINGKRWFPYNKGGQFRSWYGNNEYLVNWENDGQEIKELAVQKYNSITRSITNMQFYFKECITYTFISDFMLGVRYSPSGFIFDVAGSSIFSENNILLYILALLGSSIADMYLHICNPTFNFQVGDIKNIPVIFSNKYKTKIDKLVQQNISISRTDWDTFENSWDFKVLPLVNFNKYMENYYNSLQEIGIIAERKSTYIANLEHAYEQYKEFTNLQFEQLKANEEELNRIFIEIYGLEDELTSEVSDKDITIAKIFDTKEEIYDDIKGNRYILTKEDVIKSFISYGIGCIFGRYSLDVEGLAYAGGQWDASKYTSFIPTKDNIVLITDEEYFEDDIVNRFVEFVKVVYGEETLEENLNFIADALGGKGSPKEIIRNYFLKDFYKDHVKTYQKRPIYWQYDSGKQNGFKALIYMHRYDEDTTGKVRISYLHQLQKAYERVMDNLKYEIANNKNPREVAQAEKRLTKLTKQLKECKDYDEKIGHLAISRIAIDLDDGVKVNYEKVQTDEKGKILGILGKI